MSTTTSTQSTPKRHVNLAYVAVPRSPWSVNKNSFVTPNVSPRKQQKLRMQDTPDDLGGYGESDFESPVKRRGITDSIKSTGRRTGDRDDRGMCPPLYP
jgi:cohesin loading factor subunit SCC2